MAGDKYLDWLKAQREKILKEITDPFFRKVLLEVHDEYANTYIIMKG